MPQQLLTPSPLIAKRSSSKVSVWVRLNMAGGSGVIVRNPLNTLVANVAELILAFSADKQVLSVSLSVDSLTLRASCAVLKVNERIAFVA
jgi:hypothetical protein